MKMSFKYRFEAAHRLTSSASPMCQTPHGHTWYVTIHWQAQNDQLNGDNMLAEFQHVKGPWKKFVQETLDHSFFFHNEDPVAESMKANIEGFRGLAIPGDPTTEMLAVLFLRKAVAFSQNQKDIPLYPVAIDLQETEVNSVFLEVDSPVYLSAKKSLPPKGWWESPELNSRFF